MQVRTQTVCHMLPTEMKKTIARFKQAYPELNRYGNTYQECGNMVINILIPNVGKVRYDYFDNELTWLEVWEDPRKTKRLENEYRPQTYEFFCSAIKQYMDDNQMTQEEFAEMVDISRRSLIKYLNGHAIPKVNTMQRILKTININI